MTQPQYTSKRDSGTRWMLACGVGCGALLLIGVMAIIAVFSAVRYGFEEAAQEFRAGLENQYAELIEEEKIPDEHADVFERIYQAGRNEEASFLTTLMALVVLSGHLEDGDVTEAEAESAATLADALESNPDMGLIEFGQFVEDHPEFEEAFRDAQRAFENMESGSDWSQDFDTEEPAVDSESL